MNYYISPSSFSAVFAVPSEVVDKHIRLAGAIQLKVILYFLRNMADNVSIEKMADALGITVSDASDALLYWSDAGILIAKDAPVTVKPTEKTQAVKRISKPSHTDIARRGSDDPKISFLLREAQLKFGRNLKSNEASTLVWLYDDEGMDVSLILMLVQFAISQNRCNISFIEKTAIEWINSGIASISDAEKKVAETIRQKQAWSIVEAAFGFEKRMPSTRELELSDKWINEWKISGELLKCAYETCVDSKSKFSMPYIAKILENWHNSGYTSPEDTKRKQKPDNNDAKYAAYDLDLFEKMLNSKD